MPSTRHDKLSPSAHRRSSILYAVSVSFDLTGNNGDTVNVNVWNWRATLELLRRERLLSEDTVALAGINFTSAPVTASEAGRIAVFLDRFLEQLRLDQRVLLDGAVTDEPDTFELFRDNLTKNYSATVPWLTEFRDFCRSSGGFVID